MGNILPIRTFCGFQGDYLSDRIIRIYSVILFMVLAIVIYTNTSHEGALTCWTPAQFTGPHIQYTNSLCRLETPETATLKAINSHRGFVNDDTSVLNFSKMRSFPIVLGLQSLLFLIPWLLWKLLSGSICNLNAVINEACLQNRNSESGFAIFTNIQKLLLEPCSLLGTTGGGIALSFSYLLTKLFYWIICVIQMAIISSYFDINFFTFRTGHYLWEPYTYTNTSDVMEIYDNITTVSTRTETVTPFPRVIFCFFEIYWQTRATEFRVQCTVKVAETIEHCLTLIWIWLILVLVVESSSGIVHLFHVIVRCARSTSYKCDFLRKRLSGSESFNMASTDVIQKFISMYLKPDLFFVIQMIEENGSISASVAALKGLWEDFLKASKIQINPRKLAADDVRPLVDEMYPSDRGQLIPDAVEAQLHCHDAEAEF